VVLKLQFVRLSEKFVQIVQCIIKRKYKFELYKFLKENYQNESKHWYWNGTDEHRDELMQDWELAR